MSKRYPCERLMPETAIELQRMFGEAPQNWRTIAIKHALLEFASTLSSVLAPDRGPDRHGLVLTFAQAELLLLKLAPRLIDEATKATHRDRLIDAAARLSTGHDVQLAPLVAAAIADLQQIEALQHGLVEHEQTEESSP